MKGRSAACVAAILGTALAVVPASSADEHPALGAPRHAVETADFRAVGHLVRVDAGGTRTSYPITIKGHWFPGVLRVFVDVEPAGLGAGHKDASAVPVHVLLELRPGGATSIRVAHPGDAAMVALPVEKWTDGLAGTGFSYEDFFEEQYFWSGQTVTGDVKYGAHICDLVKSTPGPADRTHYAAVSTWLDHTIGFPVYVEKTVKAGAQVKQYTYYGLRKESGVWSASQIEEKNLGQAGSTLLIIDRGSPKSNLSLADFGAEQLLRFH